MGGPTRIPTLDASFPDALLPLSQSNMAAAASQGAPGVTALVDAATIATDASKGNAFGVTLAGNRTMGPPTSLKAGQWYTWIVLQDSNGTRTLAFDALWDFGAGGTPVINTGNGASTVIEAIYDGTKLRAGFLTPAIIKVATQLESDGSGNAIYAPNGNVLLKSLGATNMGAQAITAVGNTVDGSALVNALTTNANLTLTSTPSITAGAAGQFLAILNNGANNLVLQDRTAQLVGSAVELGNAKVTLTLQPGCGAVFVNIGGTFWQLLAHNGTLA